MTQFSKIAVTVPTYNEKDNIIKLITQVHEFLPQADILVVDDSSPDGTADIVKDYMKENSFVKLKVRSVKEGLGAAYVDGFQTLIDQEYEVIYQMDADFSHQPKYLPEMLQEIEQGYDVVIGSRYVRGGGTRNWSFIRKLISRGGSLYASTVLGLKINDVTGGYKCWRASTLKDVIRTPLKLSGFGFQIEMSFRTHLMKAKLKEIPIIFPDREEGESKMSGKIFKEALSGVWKLRLMGMKIFDK